MSIEKILKAVSELSDLKTAFTDQVTPKLRDQIPAKKQEVIKLVEEL